jgi:exopolysaccharide biosynthesis protein
MIRRLWAPVYAFVAALFTVYLLLSTFVLRSNVQTGATEQNTAMFETLSSSEEAADPFEKETAGDTGGSTDGTGNTHHGHGRGKGKRSGGSGGSQSGSQSSSETQSGSVTSESAAAEGTKTVVDTYEGDGETITLTQYRENGTTIYVADVVLDSAQSLQTAFAEDSFGRNVTEATSVIAQAHNAVLAINGDYYGARESGYVIRNGVVYRDSVGESELLCVYADGTMKVVQPGEYTAQELVEQGVWQAFSFGPGIVENGSVSVTQGEDVGKAMASNPRTAIGMISPNHYVFVVSDGRTSESTGLSLYQLAQFMEGLGCTTAYNLDGGGSSTMYFNGRVVNNPTTNGRIRERGVSDIVYIGA